MHVKFNVGDIRWFFKNIPLVKDAASSPAKIVRISANDDVVTLHNHDYTFGVRATFPAVVAENGKVDILARYIRDALVFLPDNADILLYDKDRRIVIEFPYMVLRVPYVADAISFDFPSKGALLFSADGSFLLDGIDAARNTNTISNDTGYKGIYFDMRDKPCIVSTTGKILTHFNLNLGALNTNSYFLSTETTVRLAKILLADQNVSVYAKDDSILFFEFGNYLCYARATEINFANYHLVLDNPRISLEIKVSTRQLIDAVSKIKAAVDDVYRVVILVLEETIAGDVLRISYSTDATQAETAIPAEVLRLSNEDTFSKIGIRIDYLLNVLSVFTTEQISLYVYDEKTPLIIKDGNNKTIFVMGVIL